MGANFTLVVFPSELGWMAVEVTNSAAGRLSFGYPSADEAIQAMDRSKLAKPSARANVSKEKSQVFANRLGSSHRRKSVPSGASPADLILLSDRLKSSELRRLLPWQRQLVKLLQGYARGASVDFSSVPVQLDAASDFRRNVLNACRKIPYGRTVSYGQLAAQVGVPGAARAVGTCMARNSLPLLIPCHRVTRAGGEIGPYSACEGTKTKRRLLDMEAAHA
jgi:O-6-methylguanine DNA methyltransferase